jgi:uncharacterized protein YbjT (DUF2867 family)
MKAHHPLKVLVYGATGAQAATVPAHLLAAGHQPHVFTRSAAKASVPPGAVVVEGDLADAARLRAVSAGMDAVSLLLPFFAPPAEALRYGRQAIDAARAAGVRLLVWNASGFIPAEPTGNPAIDLRLELRDYLQRSGLPHVIVQPSVYLENLLGPWTAPYVAQQDQVAYPVPPDMPVSWIAAADVSALVAAALARPELAGRSWRVSGLANPDGAALAQAFSEGLGRPVAYYAMPPRDFGAVLDEAFGPGAGAAAASEYQRLWDHPQQRPDFQADMQPVLQQLPVPMTSISAWVRRHRHVFSPAVPVGVA